MRCHPRAKAAVAVASLALLGTAGIGSPVSSAGGSVTWWHPGPLSSWQYAIGEGYPIAVPTNIGNVQAYDLDLGDQAGVSQSEVAASVAAVHASGARAICYVSAGTWEDWRSDASSYPASILGDDDPGWAGERFVDIRQWSVLGPILTARFQLCRTEGFDAVETDNDDTYTATTGFPLTLANEETFVSEMANVIHGLGMAWFLKNGVNGDSFISTVEPLADGTVNEQCWQYSECSALEPFVAAGKPILNVEYANEAEATVCPEAIAFPMATIHTDLNLDGNIAWGCWEFSGGTTTTSTHPTATTSAVHQTTTTSGAGTGGASPPPPGPPAGPSGPGLPGPVASPTTTAASSYQAARAPVFTSPASVTATVGHRLWFKVATSGRPVPSLAHSMLPKGLRWSAKGNGTAILSGVPDAIAAGMTRVLLSAASSAGRARQVLTIKVWRPVGISSGPPPAAMVGRPYRFVIEAYGYPSPQIAEVGALPRGLAFARSGRTVAVVSGVPAAGTGGAHSVTLTVSNALGADLWKYRLVVGERPFITSAQVVQARPGTSFSFVVKARGYPLPHFGHSVLPGWLRWDYLGGAAVRIAGTAPLAEAGSEKVTFTANNAYGSATQRIVIRFAAQGGG